MNNYTIRPAKEDDCQDMMQLIQELAEYGNEILRITADDLKRDGFGAEPKFQCFVAEQTASDGSGERGRLIGYSLQSYPYSTYVGQYCFLNGLYVMPDWRGHGAGTALLAHVTKAALEKGCQNLQWSARGWNKAGLEFYNRHGGVNVTETEDKLMYRMTRPVMEQFVVQSGL